MTSSSRKSVLITGCSQGGIGWALAHKLHKEGLQVIATARRAEAMKDLEDAGITTVTLDVTDKNSVLDAKEKVISITGGTLDILINNAGQALFDPALDLDLDNTRKMFEVNVFGVMMMVKTFTELLISSGNSPRIVMIGSISAEMPAVFFSAYAASKGALNSYANTLRLELAPFGVQVTSIITGLVDTNIHDRYNISENSAYAPMRDVWASLEVPKPRMMDVNLYAEKVAIKILGQRLDPWIYEGGLVGAVWLMTRFLPIRVLDWIVSKSSGLAAFARLLKQK